MNIEIINTKDSVEIKTTEGKKISLEPSCLLVFIDETGNDVSFDEKHPVFGLGGCVVLASDYDKLVSTPWNNLKNNYFKGVDEPLHASKLNSPVSQQLEALNDFFKNNNFGRVASIVCKDTVNNVNSSNKTYETTARFLIERITKIRIGNITSVAFFIEESSRDYKLVKQYFSKYKIKFGIDIPNYYFLTGKSLNLPGLEVADFIIHTAGAQVRNRLIHKNERNRKDFDLIFGSVNEGLTSFGAISSAIPLNIYK